MKIYIASSWKNEHAVVMLTSVLRADGHEVLSFVENNYGEGPGAEKPVSFEEWVKTEKADQSFDYDTMSAAHADLVIYIGPSGQDAWAEVGLAWGAGVPIFGLWAKGEQIGLMRKMVTWAPNVKVLLDMVGEVEDE